MRRPILGGFTLLEVMVAMMILGISLTAIFSSEGGAIRAGARARMMTTATLLARCKMAEVEEQMTREGFPAVMADGDDECCEDGEQPGFSCHWQVEQVLLPDPSTMDDDPLGLNGGGDDSAGANGANGANGGPGANLESALSGAAGGDAIGQFAVQYAMPILQPMIEQQVRRASVSVRWREGPDARDVAGPCAEGERNCFTVVQYLVADQGISVPGTGTTDDLTGNNGGNNAGNNGGNNGGNNAGNNRNPPGFGR